MCNRVRKRKEKETDLVLGVQQTFSPSLIRLYTKGGNVMIKDKMAREKRVKVVSTRLTNNDWSKMQSACRESKVTSSDYVRGLILANVTASSKPTNLIGLLQAVS